MLIGKLFICNSVNLMWKEKRMNAHLITVHMDTCINFVHIRTYECSYEHCSYKNVWTFIWTLFIQECMNVHMNIVHMYVYECSCEQYWCKFCIKNRVENVSKWKIVFIYGNLHVRYVKWLDKILMYVL